MISSLINNITNASASLANASTLNTNQVVSSLINASQETLEDLAEFGSFISQARFMAVVYATLILVFINLFINCCLCIKGRKERIQPERIQTEP